MSGRSRPFRAALIQMRCSTDPDDNLRRACEMLREAASKGRRSPACPSCSGPSTSARPRTPPGSTWPSRSPARRPRLWPESRARRAWSWSARSSRGGRRESITTPRSSSTPTARSAGGIARCTSPTIRCTTRSITSRPATSASRRSDAGSPASARWSAGTSGIPRPPG